MPASALILRRNVQSLISDAKGNFPTWQNLTKNTRTYLALTSTRKTLQKMRGLLPFFGVRTAGASDEDLHRGRRRVVALTGFLTFILAVAAATSQNWVSGGLEYSFTSLAEAPLCESCGLSAPSLGATVRVEFALGLSQLGQSTEYDYPYTGELNLPLFGSASATTLAENVPSRLRLGCWRHPSIARCFLRRHRVFLPLLLQNLPSCRRARDP